MLAILVNGQRTGGLKIFLTNTATMKLVDFLKPIRNTSKLLKSLHKQQY
jgi:hypothetical protein